MFPATNQYEHMMCVMTNTPWGQLNCLQNESRTFITCHMTPPCKQNMACVLHKEMLTFSWLVCCQSRAESKMSDKSLCLRSCIKDLSRIGPNESTCATFQATKQKGLKSQWSFSFLRWCNVSRRTADGNSALAENASCLWALSTQFK